jgi:hypothetical protein
LSNEALQESLKHDTWPGKVQGSGVRITACLIIVGVDLEKWWLSGEWKEIFG